MNLQEIRKAIVALVVPVVVAGLANAGFDASPEVVTAVTALVTAVLVWAVPNQTPSDAE